MFPRAAARPLPHASFPAETRFPSPLSPPLSLSFFFLPLFPPFFFSLRRQFRYDTRVIGRIASLASDILLGIIPSGVLKGLNLVAAPPPSPPLSLSLSLSLSLRDPTVLIRLDYEFYEQSARIAPG